MAGFDNDVLYSSGATITGPTTINSGTGTFALSTDASNTTIDIGTGAAVKTVTIGSTNSTSATVIQAGSGSVKLGTVIYPSAPLTSGKILISDGTNIVGSTPTFPNSATSTGTILRADGTNWVATTATYPTTTTAFQLVASTATNVIGEIAAGATGTVLIGNTGAVPSFSTAPVVTSITTGTVNGNATLAISTANQTITMNSGTGAIAISNDAANTTVDLGTGAGAKLVTVGSTNGASSLALKTGTADFSLASATGTIISALDTGEITMPLQCAFMAYQASDQLNCTGDGTVYTLGTTTDLTEVFDQNSDFNPTSGVFTAPVTGRYHLSSNIAIGGVLTTHTVGGWSLVTSNRTYAIFPFSPGKVFDNSTNSGVCLTTLADMDAADTCTATVAISNGTKVVDVLGNALVFTNFSGYLEC